MIRHFVLVRFRSDVGDEEIASAFKELAALRDHLKGVLDFHAGPNVSVEANLIRGYRHAFWFDFENSISRDAYLADDRHQAAGARLVALADGGIEGITVVDMEF